MLSLIDSLTQEHHRLRQLLQGCEAAAPSELRGSLGPLRQTFVALKGVKERLYGDADAACRAEGDDSGLIVLGILCRNTLVMSDAILSFLANLDSVPDAHLQPRFRTVAQAMRSVLDVEERSLFPLCQRHASPPAVVPPAEELSAGASARRVSA